MTLTGYLVAAALAKAQDQPGPRPVAHAPERATRAALLEVNRARSDLRHVGGLLNQLARVANTTGELPPGLRDVLAAVDRAVADVDDTTVKLAGR